MEKISIITPLYRGQQFIDNIVHNAEKLYEKVRPLGYSVELILVNDSPNEELIIPNCQEFDIKLFKNKQNFGIQQTRVNGLEKSVGEYIIFLDQDDDLIVEHYDQQLQLISDADVVVGNLYMDRNGQKEAIYKNVKQLKCMISEDYITNVVNPIISPGQCLIRRSAIPQEWKNSIMKVNGVDDWLLWILLFMHSAQFAVNGEIVYYHRTTEVGNFSSDKQKMYDSEMEMIEILKRYGYSEKGIESLKETARYIHKRRETSMWSIRSHIFKLLEYRLKFLKLGR